MSTAFTDTNSIFDADILEPRSLSDIEDQLDGARALRADAVNRLRAARSTFGNAVGGGSSEAYLLSVQSEHLPLLRAVEQEIVESIDRHLLTLHEDRRTLVGSAWRPDPLLTGSSTYGAALVVAQSQLETLAPDALLATIQSAILHRDKVQAAAFATLADRLTSRDLPIWERASLQAAVGQCRSLTGEQSTQRVLTDLDRERVALQDLRSDVVLTANAVEPSVGDALDRAMFGVALGGPRLAAPPSREDMFRRAGAGEVT